MNQSHEKDMEERWMRGVDMGGVVAVPFTALNLVMQVGAGVPQN